MMLCLLYRWRISNTFDSSGELSGACRRHLMRCARCRSFFTSFLAVGERLSLEATMTQPAVPRRLGAQVAATIGRRTGVEDRQWSAYWPSLAAACAAVIMMPAAFLLIFSMRANQADRPAVPPATAARGLFGDIFTVDQFAESVGGLLERPLAAEVEELQRQTKSAVEFLMTCSGADLARGRQAL